MASFVLYRAVRAILINNPDSSAVGIMTQRQISLLVSIRIRIGSPAVFPGSGAVIGAESGGEMLRGGVAQLFRDGRDILGLIGKQDGSGRHFGLCLFLLVGFAVVFQQEPLSLPGAAPQPFGQFFQG